MTDVQTWLAVLGVILGPSGAAWIGVKMSVNGMREDVRTIKGDVKELRSGQITNGNRLTALETKAGP